MSIRVMQSPAELAAKIRRYGFGRLIIGSVKGYPNIAWSLREPIRASKIAIDFSGYLRRRRLAAEIKKISPFANYFPEETAFRCALPGSFEAIDKIIPVAKRIYGEFRLRQGQAPKNRSWAYYISSEGDGPSGDAEVADLLRYPELQELASSEPLIHVAAGYLGEVPILGHIGLQVVEPNAETDGFQLFHFDQDAKRQVKIFIAIEDVDDGNGATMLLPANISKVVRSRIGHKWGRISDDAVDAATPRENLLKAAGPAGSAFFFDPCRQIHAGARTRARPRVLIHMQYTTKYCYGETNLQRGLIRFDRKKAAQNDLTSLVFNLE